MVNLHKEIWKYDSTALAEGERISNSFSSSLFDRRIVVVYLSSFDRRIVVVYRRSIRFDCRPSVDQSCRVEMEFFRKKDAWRYHSTTHAEGGCRRRRSLRRRSLSRRCRSLNRRCRNNRRCRKSRTRPPIHLRLKRGSVAGHLTGRQRVEQGRVSLR